MMGESPGIANRIFVAHGHRDVWEQLRGILERLRLPVEHFNAEATAGLLTTDRWKRMLNRSRFAFAVMTRDDRVGDELYRARQNVVHEIGLCHARLGIHNTAILIEEGTERFSNIDGVTCIPFPPGRLDTVEGEVEDLLKSRGLL
jgi:predicted nucleotide-binding protein